MLEACVGRYMHEHKKCSFCLFFSFKWLEDWWSSVHQYIVHAVADRTLL